MKKSFIALIYTFVLSVSLFAQSEACPKIEVVGGGVVQPEEPMNFSVKLSDDAKLSAVEYEWTVSAGAIASGQDTSSITVDTTGLSGQNVTAQVSVKGLSETCLKTASETGSVQPEPPVEMLDEFGKLSDNDVKARIGALFVTLGNLPTYYAYIINYGTPGEIADRERQIRKAIKFRKYDASRVKLIRGGANPNGKVWTKVWTFPPDFKRIPKP